LTATGLAGSVGSFPVTSSPPVARTLWENGFLYYTNIATVEKQCACFCTWHCWAVETLKNTGAISRIPKHPRWRIFPTSLKTTTQWQHTE